jgi:hypothetical protein
MHGSPFLVPTGAAPSLTTATIDFTDGCLVVAIGFALFWAIDPFSFQLWRHSVTRHIPTLIAIGAVILNVAGRLIFRSGSRNELAAAFRIYFGLTLFAIFVIAGSLYAKYVIGIENTFLSMGVFLIFGGPVTLWIIRTSSAPLALIRRISFVFIVISFLAVAANAAQYGTLVFHSAEHIVLASVAFPLIAGKRFSIRAGGAALVILGALAEHKLTGYLVMLMIFAWVYVDELMAWSARDADRVRASLRLCLGAMVALIGAIALLVVYESTKSQLPDGNTIYRVHTYTIAFNRFLDSWIWGRGFAAPAVDYFDLFVVNTSTQYLPTHNDPLDILANGGLLAAVPFASGLLFIILVGLKALSANWRPGERDLGPVRPQLAMYFLIVVTGIPVMTFNPVLNQTTLTYIYWTASAVMCALVMIARADNAKSELSGGLPNVGAKGREAPASL